MMYSEFIEGTGCRENDHNYEVFENLNVMYMHSNMTKEQIYEYGKKLVDNSLSKEQLEWNEEVNERIRELKKELEGYKQEAEMNKNSAEFWKEEYKRTGEDEAKELWQMDRDSIAVYKGFIKQTRSQIKLAKSMLYV